MQYQSDYVLRLIEQMGALIRRALEHYGEADPGEPFELAQQVIGLALEMDPDVVGRLSPDSLKSLIDLQSFDDRVLVLVAEALDIEADALEGVGEVLNGALRREQSSAVRSLMDPTRAN